MASLARSWPLPPLSPRVRLWLLLGPVVIGIIGAYVGSALHPTLAVDHPVVLIILNPRNYHLTLVARQMSFLTFAVVAIGRLVTLDPLLYLVGRWYGPAGRRWLERQTDASHGVLTWLDRWFPRVSWLLVFAAPNTYVCLLAGVTKMRVGLFAALNLTGTIARVLLIWWAAGAVQDQLDAVLRFFSRYQRPLTLAAIALVAVQILVSMRKQSGELSEIRSLEHELELDDDATVDRDTGAATDADTDATDADHTDH